jgi:membrane protein DedA with SNARE-associated domain
MHPFIKWLFDVAKWVGGYPGIFVTSLLGNLLPFMPIPYLFVVYLYATFIPGSNPILVGIVSGLGGGVGKLLVYLASREGAHVVLSEESQKRYERIGKLLGNYGALMVFLFAVTPSPDDVIIIPLGLMKYDPLRFFVAVTIGKILISIATAYAGKTVAVLTKESLLYEIIASILLFLFVMILLVIVDWELLLTDLGEKGLQRFLMELRRNGFSRYLRRTNRAREDTGNSKS